MSKKKLHQSKWMVLATLAALASPVMLPAADAPSTPSVPSAPSAPQAAATVEASAKAQKMMQKAAAYLIAHQQPDGAWGSAMAPVGLNALVLKAIVQTPGMDASNPAIKKGYEKLLSYQMESGGIYKDSLASYNTAIAISALAAANNKDYRPNIDKAVGYLKSLQWKDKIAGPTGEKVDPANPWYGGWGYGGKGRGAGRPDLSNTQMALDALHDSGLKADDPAYQAALKFVTRLQNASETNDQSWAGDDGGFVYGPSDNGKGESMAGEYVGADGKRLLRSYGSMTYAGLKSMIYAGLSKDDPRVKAAWNWLRNNWSLEENAGMRLGNPANAKFGMYYYYHTLARAMHAYGEPAIVDIQGNKHDWRLELIDKLAILQQEDGSWVGDKKWMENNPILTTAYVVLSLQEANSSLAGK